MLGFFNWDVFLEKGLGFLVSGSIIITMNKILIFLVLILCFNAFSWAGTVSFTLDRGAYNFVPEPRLRYPINETAIINNNQPLEFSWWDDFTGTSGFILKLYKGYNMYSDNLILKEKLLNGADFFKVKADLFEDGQVYTWSLQRIVFSGHKSDRSFNSFRVIKK